jgi:hypothetical protein
MSWKEVSASSWERPLDNNELLLKYVADIFKPLNKEHWALNIIATAKFDEASENENISALRRAWIQVRYQHPLIAASLNGDSHSYHVPSDTDIESWVSETFLVHEGKTARDFLLTVPFKEHSSLHFFPSSSEILMRTHHWTIDGIGALHLIDRFFTYLSVDGPVPSFGLETTRLAPSYLEAAGLPTKPSASSETKAQNVFMNYVSKLPSVGLPIQPLTVPGGTKVVKLTSSPSTLSLILTATRKQNIGLAAAVQSALVLATRERAPAALSKQNFSTIAFFNHRKHLKAPYTDSASWPMAVWMVGLPISQPEADFATTAKSMQDIYGQDMAINNCEAIEWYDGFCARMVKVLSSPMPEGVAPPSQPQLSSIGLVDGLVKSRYDGKRGLDVKSVEPVLDNMAAAMIVFQWSFGGTWYLNGCYNEKIYTDADAEAFLKRVKEILFSELGVEEAE